MFWSQVSHANRTLECRAGRDDLDENTANMVCGKRPRIVCNRAIDDLALTRWLIDRRAIGLLQMADLLRDPSPFREQADQFQVDFVDPLAQIGERGLLGP